MRKIRKIVHLLLCGLLSCALLLSACAMEHVHEFKQTVIPPTCNSIGYTVNACACGETYYSDYQAEAPHTFSDWTTERVATLIAGGEEYRICTVCGVLQTRDTENLSALPKLYLDDSSDGGSILSLRYVAGETERFSCSALLSVLPKTEGGKQTCTLQLVTNTNPDRPYLVDFGWGERSSYLLSPQRLDPTFSRTPAAEAIWNACLALQNGANEPNWKKTALTAIMRSNGSAAVQLYRNGVYDGLYLLTLPQTDLFPAETGTTVAALRAEDESSGCLFLANPAYTDDATGNPTGFRFLVCSTSDTEWATGSFSGFVEFVRRSRDAAFREQLSQYTDLTLLMDYFLLLHMFGAPYGDTAGTIWYTVDGVHWLPTFSDYQASFGVAADGSLLAGADGVPTPEENGNGMYTGQNLLWGRLIALFPAELSQRYQTLRKTLLDPDNLYDAFLEQYERIEPELHDAENALSSAPAGAEETERVKKFLSDRIAAMDHWMDAVADSALLPDPEL